MSIELKILQIADEVGIIEKTGQGPQSQGSYKFLKIEDIITKLRPLMIKHKVVTRMEVNEEQHEYDYATDKMSLEGKVITDGRNRPVRSKQHVRVTFDFIDAEDGSVFSVPSIGEAQDSSDKAIRKAVTQAHKIALMQTFFIHDGEPDPDSTDPSEVKEPSEPRQDRGAQNRTTASRTRTATAKKVEASAEAPAAEAPAAPDDESKPVTEPEPTPGATEPEAAPAAPPREEPVGPIEETPDALKQAKAEMRAATAARGGMAPDELDALARKVTGAERPKWINSARMVSAIAKAIAAGEVA